MVETHNEKAEPNERQDTAMAKEYLLLGEVELRLIPDTRVGNIWIFLACLLKSLSTEMVSAVLKKRRKYGGKRCQQQTWHLVE